LRERGCAAARIRPHFLFSSLHPVLALVAATRGAPSARSGPADLFRALMSDRRSPGAPGDNLARQALREQLRRARLRMSWDLDQRQ
jgi:hypothetical protein